MHVRVLAEVRTVFNRMLRHTGETVEADKGDVVHLADDELTLAVARHHIEATPPLLEEVGAVETPTPPVVAPAPPAAPPSVPDTGHDDHEADTPAEPENTEPSTDVATD